MSNDDIELQLFGDVAREFIDKLDLQMEVQLSGSYFDKLDVIKSYYDKNLNDILKAFVYNKNLFHNPYPIDWSIIMSPIELCAWLTIRNKGRIVLYPQFPVLNYHLDFANPGLKIALELDGEKFHDVERDKKRDAALNELGWTVYRIPGKEMVRSNYLVFNDIISLDEDEDEKIRQLRYWIMETGDGVIEAIKSVYFKDENIGKELHSVYEYYCRNTLEKHQL